MYTKLILTTLCSLALAAPQYPYWQPAQYPHWQSAPAVWAAPAPAWNHQPAAPAWPSASAPAGASPVTDAGEKVKEAPPLIGWKKRLYPAGVSAEDCFNYPWCPTE